MCSLLTWIYSSLYFYTTMGYSLEPALGLFSISNGALQITSYTESIWNFVTPARPAPPRGVLARTGGMRADDGAVDLAN